MTGVRILLITLFLLSGSTAAKAGAYFEAGTSYGLLSSGDSFFGRSNAKGSGFIGSFNFYVPITSERRFVHLELGLQNRFSTFSNDAGQSFAALSPNFSMRLQLWRLYAGAGYAPLVLTGDGLTGLKTASGSNSYFVEGGMIWRVIPEFQIAATAALEFGKPSSGSQSTSTEFGIRFRFPINPKESGGGGGSGDFDGFRYPFGIMK